MVFLQVMGVLFCIVLVFGVWGGCLKLYTIYDDMDNKIESLNHYSTDIYERLRELESDNIKRGNSRG
jgi:hypothetical protein